MAFCKITLYKQPILTKDKNFIIESFSDYLSTLSKITINSIQYIKPQLENIIKLAQLNSAIQEQIGENSLLPTMYAYYNYLKVEYYEKDSSGVSSQTNQNTGYYFINSWKWLSYNTAEISITMDVLNTIGVPSASNKFCNWDSKTLIQRQHTKRYITDSGIDYWKIDKRSEGLVAPQYLKESKELFSKNAAKVKWNLVFTNTLDDPTDANNVVQLYLVPDTNVSVVDAIDPNNPITYTVYGYYDNNWTSKAVDPKIIKIVQVPYMPTSDISQINDTTFKFTSTNYRVVSNMVEVQNVNSFFNNTFDAYMKIENSFYKDTIKNDITGVYSAQQNYLNTDASRNPDAEPKIFHSDFYTNKILYDQNSKNIKMENCDLTKSGEYTVNYVVSNNLASKILFKFTIPCFTDHQEDFETSLISARDNSRMQYNYAYYNYKMNQAGWDQYKMENSLAFNTLRTLTPALSQQGTISGAVSGIINAAQTYVNGNESMMETEARLKQQAISVRGSDDLSLFETYSGNTLRRNVYMVSDTFKNFLLDLFYYNGYAINERDVPDTSNRYWFNYVQCEPVFKSMLLDLPEGVWDEYKNKWKEGTTVFHYHSSPKGESVTKKWCLEQDLENLESDLL